MTKDNILSILKKEQPYLRQKFFVKRIAIFGSVAKGKDTPKSDIDIFVEFKQPVGVEFIRLAEYLEKRLGRKIDVLTPGGVATIRQKKIANDIRRSLIYV